MQTLRKKNSPCKFKKEPTRFLGEGVSFKAKLIGILEVSEARGDRMCQAALADLKMAIRAAGEHKQRIAVQVSIDGLRLRDEKTGECLYHHPVHKISFIAQDMSDSRAFGYIFGSPDTGHRFFGIKTDKAANQVVIAMRDLFQVVFELKKKEIELTKQNIERNVSKCNVSAIFVESAPDTKGAAGTEMCQRRIRRASLDVDKISSNSSINDKKNETQTGVIADLLDLQSELNSLKQGIHQMDKITPDNPRPSSEDPFEADPFGDSFANIKVTASVQPILPPPPSSSKRGHLERQQTIPAAQSSVTSSPATQPVAPSKSPPPQESIQWLDNDSEKRFSDGEIASLTNTGSADEEKENGSTGTGPRKSPQIDVFTELDPLGTGLSKPYIDKKDFFQHLKNPPKKVLKDLVTTSSGDTFPTNFDISLESLDPIKVQTDSRRKSTETFEDGDFANFEKFDNENEIPAREAVETTLPPPPATLASKVDSPQQQLGNRSTQRMIHHQPLSVSLPPEDSPVHHKSFYLRNTPPPSAAISSIPRMDKEPSDSIQSLMRLPSPKKYHQSMRKKDFDMELSAVSRLRESIDKPFPVDFSNAGESPASPLRSCSSDANSRPSSSSAELDIVPEPPPRGAGSILINPPPLPPKKQGVRSGGKPPPRPPHTDSHLHYDFIEREETSPSPTRRERPKSPARFDDNKPRFDDNFSPPSPHTLRQSEIGTIGGGMSSSRFDTMTPTTLSTLFRNPYISNVSGESKKVTATTTSTITTRPSLDITLSQLTSSNLAEFATSLDMSVAELTSLTLQQLTECLARLSARETNGSSNSQLDNTSPAPRTVSGSYTKTTSNTVDLVETSFVSSEPLFKADFDQEIQQPTQPVEEQPVYDKYAVFRELLEMDQMREDVNGSEINDSGETMPNQESPDHQREPDSNLITDDTREVNDELFRVSNLLSACDLSVDLPPVDDHLPSEESRMNVGFKDRAMEEDEKEVNDEQSREHPRTRYQTETEARRNSREYREERRMSLEKHETEVVTGGKKSPRGKITREEGEGQGDFEEEAEEEEEDEDEEDDDEEEEDDEIAAVHDDSVPKTSTSDMKLVSLTSETKDRYAALREIDDDVESPIKDRSTVEEQPTLVTSPIQQQTPKTLAEQDLLKLFSEPSVERMSPRKPMSRNEEDLRAVTADIFEEIRMLNSSGDQCTLSCRLTKSTAVPAVATGFEDVFCTFVDPKGDSSKDGRESTGSVKDDGNWAKFESSAVFHSDKSSYEGQGSVGGTSPWSPDEKDFHMEGGVGTKSMLKQQQQPHRLHSGESDNEWKDDEESEGSNGKRQYCDEGGLWRRYPRFEMPEDGVSFYEETLDRADKERHFRDRGSRKSRGVPWPKQAGAHRTRSISSPWHEEPSGRAWPRDEEETHHGIQRGRYPPNRKQMSASYKEELEDTSKGYWKCRTKQRPWNGDREGFRTSSQQQPVQSGLQQPSHFPGEPIFYEDDRSKRRMMLWNEERDDERDRDRFSSQESMGYDDEERWSRGRDYDRRRERWDEDGGNRFWPRRTPESESRVDPRLDPRGEYGPPPIHDMYRKQHYCRGDGRELRERSAAPHDLYIPGSVGPTGCWPEDEYSLPLSDRPDNSPRYLTRKRHWPKRPNSANDERNLAEPVYADPRFKYGMSRSECSDNDSDLYHRPYRSRSRESYWGSDQEFESWGGGGGSGSERLYWSEGPDTKSETLHRRRMNRHKSNRPTTQKSQSSPFENDFTEAIDPTEVTFDSLVPDASRDLVTDIVEAKSPSTRNVKEHLRKDPRCGRYAKPPGTMVGSRGSGYFENETITDEASTERARSTSELKSTPEDFPSDVDKALTTGGDSFPQEEDENRDSFFNGDPSPRFDDEDDAFAFKSEMADSVPDTTTGPAATSIKNSRQIKYGNNKMKNDHDIKKSESVNIFVRESDPFDDDDFFK